MTYSEREEIFAKEVLTIKDLMAVLDIANYQTAAQLMRQIKRTTGDRYPVQGKLHVQDYLEYFKIDGGDRYCAEKRASAG